MHEVGALLSMYGWRGGVVRLAGLAARSRGPGAQVHGCAPWPSSLPAPWHRAPAGLPPVERGSCRARDRDDRFVVGEADRPALSRRAGRRRA
ncbi:hypothetical protein, partial [Streptomyces sp. NPDC004658]|uniref:hypothetical protein n=1 Tax=Streptomyces sp. NPDC004658 TaxID=3154672 RepID=UPI0033B371A6